MFNLNLLENLDISCSCFGGLMRKKTKTHHNWDEEIYTVTRDHKITLLPISHNYELENLYPITNQVELWNIFIVGCDKTYILANVNDPFIMLPEAERLQNKSGLNILPEGLNIFMNSIWDKTLSDKQLQFYMTWNGKLFFVNTYPFYNGHSKVIGAVMFMRAYDKMPEIQSSLDLGAKTPKSRKSIESNFIRKSNTNEILSSDERNSNNS